MAVTQEHFTNAMGQCNSSLLRETEVEEPHIKWDDIGGLEAHFDGARDAEDCE